MANIIARVKLARGQVGYYDDYSKIYLTPSKPEAYITAGTNLYQIKKSIRSGRLKLMEGSLMEEPKVQEVEISSVAKKASKKEEKIVAPAEKSVSEAIEAKIEEVAEAIEEPIVEKPKRSRRKKNVEQTVETVETAAETAEEALEEIPLE